MRPISIYQPYRDFFKIGNELIMGQHRNNECGMIQTMLYWNPTKKRIAVQNSVIKMAANWQPRLPLKPKKSILL